MIPTCSIRVEVYPIIPVKPVQFGILDDTGKVIGVLPYEKVKKAIDEFDVLKRKYEMIK